MVTMVFLLRNMARLQAEVRRRAMTALEQGALPMVTMLFQTGIAETAGFGAHEE